MRREFHIRVQDIREGDQFHSSDGLQWTALDDAEHKPAAMTVDVLVEYADGGRGYRAFTPGRLIYISRDVEAARPTFRVERSYLRTGFLARCRVTGCKWAGPLRPSETDAHTDGLIHEREEHLA